jgi:hypothetical protein
MDRIARAQAVIFQTRRSCTRAAALCSYALLLTKEAEELVSIAEHMQLARLLRLRGIWTIPWPQGRPLPRLSGKHPYSEG